MIKQKNLGYNALLNVIKTALSILFPLITYPYALRVLGVEKIGAVSYVESIINYFSLIAMLGVSSYAIREGAKIREDSNQLNTFANEVFTINIISTLVAYIGLALAVILVEKLSGYRLLFVISCGTILFTTLSVDWLNTIFEDYLYITIRSIAINILSMVVLFVFVKGESDYYIYAGLHTITTGAICITNLLYCQKYVRLRLTTHPNFKKHYGKLLLLFANALAISIYVNFDTTMLGWMKSDYEVGLYSASTKIYSVVKGIMIAVYTVTIPRLASYVGNKDEIGFKSLYMDLWGSLAILLIPAGVGLGVLSNEIIALFGGAEYLGASLSLKILAGALIISVFGGLVTTCLNITIGREKENLIATLLSAVLNCGLNFIFIPLLSHNGAAITTLISEGFVLLYCIIRLPDKNKYFDTKIVAVHIIHATIGAAFIAAICIAVRFIFQRLIDRIIISTAVSVVVYFLILYLLHDSLVIRYIKKIISIIHR